MQIDFKSSIDIATSATTETIDRQSDPQTETDDEFVVAANDNEIRWPFIPLPKDWYASP